MIRIQPDWKIVDPICTFLFCILVLISTLNVMKDALRVLMEGVLVIFLADTIMAVSVGITPGLQ